MSKKGLVFIFLVWTCIMGIHSQNNTSSPYTRYGYGNLVDAGFGQSKAMGGISYGLRTNKFVNPANPASYTSIDSLTFRFELGASAKLSSYSDDVATQTKLNGNLEYLAIQFPIKKWLGVSFGLLPYSFVGYDFSTTEAQSSSIASGQVTPTYSYEGSGGITQAYIGAAITPFKNLSVGANLGYNFGSIEHSSSVSFSESYYYPTYQVKSIDVTDFIGTFGLQYEIPLQKEQKITLGAVFQTKSKLGVTAEQTIITTDTVTIDNDDDFDTPLTFGAGFVYTLSDRFLAGFDYKYQAWSDVRYFGEKPFSDRNRFALGFEIQPKGISKNYLERIYYRAGVNYSNSYIKVNGENINEYGISAGFGFPLKRGLNPTILNVVFEYGNIGKKQDNLIREQYFKFTLNATINERWFMKRKFE